MMEDADPGVLREDVVEDQGAPLPARALGPRFVSARSRIRTSTHIVGPSGAFGGVDEREREIEATG
jgi:hypothetical protein